VTVHVDPEAGFGLLVDKPAGASSHDVVDFVRYALGARKVGHAGTLDPFATGLLVVLVQGATKAAPFLSGHDKVYETTIVLGAATDTADATGREVARAPVSAAVLEEAPQAAGALVGTHAWPPPAFAAVKVEGRRAHELARAGRAPDLPPRPMTVHRLEVLRVVPSPPRIQISVAVSAGTYVRSLAVALGEALGVPAHVAALRRTAAGHLGLDDARVLGDLRVEPRGRDRRGKPRVRVRPAGYEAADRATVGAFVARHAVPLDALLGFPVALLDGVRFRRLREGQVVRAILRGTFKAGQRVLARLGADPAPRGAIVAAVEPPLAPAAQEPTQVSLRPVRVLDPGA